MRQIGYITVEECTADKDLIGIGELILDEFSSMELHIVEENEAYFVVKFICEEFEEVQDLVSIISYILTGEQISKFSITINNEEA